MTLKSALQDVRETTLAAVSGLLGKLAYLASLRGTRGHYAHWGLASVYGAESSERALRSAHTEVVTAVLRTPIESLEADLRLSSRDSGFAPVVYLQKLRERFEVLLPGGKTDSPAADHLNSVLVALSSLQKSRGRATRSTS
ncbi:MAG TPA: hypothetical protein VMG31_03345 [Verrucomicrobiae bacterium]|nr:hypothetical protein [Verrucomicrobiae bacterium]